MKYIETSILLTFLLCCINSCAVDKKKGDAKPNILLILADDLGYNGLGCYGSDLVETPNIDQLCAHGMKFTDGYSAAPTCAPSRAAIMSGQYAPRTDKYRVMEHHKGKEEFMNFLMPADALELRLEKITIAEALKDDGYSTAMFGKWHLGYDKKNHPLHQGFDEAIKNTGMKHFNSGTDPHMDMPEGTYISDFFTDKGLDFIDRKADDENPFFLYMPYYLIHAPFEAKEEYIEHFKNKLPKDTPERYILWCAMTKSLDENVGQLLSKLEEKGITDNTLVIFSSDNGGVPNKVETNDFNKPLRLYKGQTYEGGMRVPYIFKWPGIIKANSVCHEPIHGIDLYPTCLDAANVIPQKDYILDGLSLMPCLTSEGQDKLDRDALYWYYPKCAGYNPKTDKWRDTWRNVIRMRDYKLIENIEFGTVELYNLKEDIGETNDLSTNMPDKVKELQSYLKRWKKSIGAAEPIPNVNRDNSNAKINQPM
ncbi:sulfatase [Labilibacter sediminis]|nr:sulfatase [Labilibacter sediminis]